MITKKEFELFLPKTFIRIDNISTEIIYDIPIVDKRIRVRIYSSIDRKTKKSFKKYVRCSLLDVRTNKIIGQLKKIKITTDWKNQVKEILHEILSDYQNLKFCKTCDSIMIVKVDDHRQFYSCSNYPDCKTILTINGIYIESDIKKEKPKKMYVSCPICNSLMKKKYTDYFDEFYGCSLYYINGCTGKRSIDEVEIYGEGVEYEN